MTLDLGIDTASDDVSLALLEGDRVVAERHWHVRETVARELLGGLDALLGEAGAERHAIASVAVDVGPGGYGGLRAGVATAQGLALALEVPLAGVVRLEADAWPHLLEAAPGTTVVAAHDAGRAGVAWAAYVLDAPEAAPRAVVAPRIDTPEEAAARAPADATWCGEVTDALRAALGAAGGEADHNAGSGHTGPRARIVAPRLRSAADLVRLARRHGAYGDAAEVDVLYLRPPAITRARPR